MGLTDTQREIANAITHLTPAWSPVATISDIAEETDLSEQAVRNHIDEVVENVTRIDTQKVGQTNVYYLNKNLIKKIENEDSVGLANLAGVRGDATYGELREVNTEDSYYWRAYWYNHNANEIKGYRPTKEEIGAVLDRPRLPATVLWDPDEVEYEEEQIEEVEE